MSNLIILLLLGTIIGSFLNVCIHRIPLHKSVVGYRSHCPKCDIPIKWYDLVPIASWFILNGHCRNCGAPISCRYSLIEFLTGIIFVFCLLIFNISHSLITAIIFSCFLVVITFIDIDHQLILDKVLVWLAGTGVAINLWLNSLNILDMLLAAFVGGGIMLVIAVASRGGMGGGDIKFAAALGIWLGWKLTLLTLFLAFILGGLGGGIVLLLKLKGRKDYIPFGPFIALGAFISLLYGNQIINWYITNFL
ncbi:MAG: prepilin peptidase [Negativicutes bacterium]